jgi:hypothetical protein
MILTFDGLYGCIITIPSSPGSHAPFRGNELFELLQDRLVITIGK